eukprot:scaffold320144_cov53-Attheya_sp.AAC.1
MSLGCLGAHGETGCCRGTWDCYVRRRQVGAFLLSSSSAVVSGMGAYSVGWDLVFWMGMVAGEMASSWLVCCPLLALAAFSEVIWRGHVGAFLHRVVVLVGSVAPFPAAAPWDGSGVPTGPAKSKGQLIYSTGEQRSSRNSST